MSDTLAELFATALPTRHTWIGTATPADLAGLPGAPAVLLLINEDDRSVLLATTQHLKRFVLARLCAPVPVRRGRADLAAVVRGLRWRAVCCPFEARWWYYRLARELHPKEYRRLVAFGPAWFLHVDWRQRVPELRVTERVYVGDGEWLGPWATHKSCQEALVGLWDLFDLCRYPDQVRQAPRGTRCPYADMDRCDAPCDGSVPLDRYVVRCRAAWRFTSGNSSEWTRAAEQRMKQAAAAQRYELAAQIKQQLDFARRWQAEWAGRIQPAAELNCLLLLPVTRRRAWKCLLFRRGALTDGPVLPDRKAPAGAAAWLSQELARVEEDTAPALRMEQTWLLCHLLHGRESASVIVAPCGQTATPTRLEELLRTRIAAARQQARTESAAAQPPPAIPEEAAPAPDDPA